MGLDNGIIIRNGGRVSKRDAQWFQSIFWQSSSDEYEVAYWRKCRNVRNAILFILRYPSENPSEILVDADKMAEIITRLRKYNSRNYEDEGSTIWTWHEFKRINRRNIRGLRRCLRLMRRDPKLEVVFYDSY